MQQSLKSTLGLSLIAPLALSSLAACAGDGDSKPDQVGSTTEEIIGGFPARAERFNAVGSLGFRIAPDPDAEDLIANYRHRPYVNSQQVARAGETHFPFCSGTLIAPNAVLTAEHCVSPLYGDEEFLIGFDGTHPARTVPIIGAMAEETLFGGFVGLGSDVAIAFLAEDVTDIEPWQWAALEPDDVGEQYIGFGFGIRNNYEDAGQRYLGMMDLRGIGGNHAENLFGSYEGFLDHYAELPYADYYAPEDFYAFMTLLPEHEASFGNAPGNAQDCYGDSGGPIVRLVDGNMTTYGVVSGGVESLELICDWGGVYSIFGPVASDFIDRALACPMIPVEGMCVGATAVRCAPPEEGGYEQVETDCSLLGLICAQDEAGEIACMEDPCADIPAEGMCVGDVAVRCSLPEEGPRRVIETDCALLGGSCGADEAGELTCVDLPEPVLSCVGNCGGAAEVGEMVCFCDDVCQEYGDCCDDYLDVCEPGGGTALTPRFSGPQTLVGPN